MLINDHCKKCEELHNIGWILDSGASVHFTKSKNDFIDYQEVHNAPPVNTAAAKNPLQIKGKGTVLLSHYVKN